MTYKQIKEIAQEVKKIVEIYGKPQDIEWAYESGKLYILQARPITTLENIPDKSEQEIIWDNSNIIESYSGVTTPLTFSFIKDVYTEVYKQFLLIMGVEREQMDAYYNETEHKRRLLDISTEHDVDYNRTQRLIEIKNECHHNNIIYRYLIEKFIYLPHIGTKILTKDKLQLLIAEAHWILHTYQYGDIIHNNLTELSLIIKDDYTIYADVSKKMLQKQNKYLEYESENDLYNNLPKIIISAKQFLNQFHQYNIYN